MTDYKKWDTLEHEINKEISLEEAAKEDAQAELHRIAAKHRAIMIANEKAYKNGDIDVEHIALEDLNEDERPELDPVEVFAELPDDLQDAFYEQDRERAITAFERLPEERATYLMRRCIQAGLWACSEEEKIEEIPNETN